MSKNKSKYSNATDLIKIAESDGTLTMLKAAIENVPAILTGALGTNKLELLMIPGRLVQAARNNKFLSQLSKEFEELKNKGKISNDFVNSEQAASSLQELLSSLENPPVDEIKFNLLKTLFLRTAIDYNTKTDNPLPQLLMSVAKDLSSGEIILLSSAYRLGKLKRPNNQVNSDASLWIKYIAENSELSTKGLVEYNEKKLIDKKLLTDRTYSDKSGIRLGSHFRLTDLGLQLCKLFLEE